MPTIGSESKIPQIHSDEDNQILPAEMRDESDDSLNQQGLALDILNGDQAEIAASDPEETGNQELEPEHPRRHRRSSIVSYKEPSTRSKLRAGDQFTFSSGYEAGIKILSMAERDRDRARRKSRQSLT